MGNVVSNDAGTGSIAVPAGCNIANSYAVDSFTFFNSTRNLNCIEYQPWSDYYTQGCLDSAGNWCDPDQDGCSNCDIDYCGDNVPRQPLGYSAPDYVSFNFSTGLYCSAANSGGSKSRDIGNGIVYCDGKEQVQFFGDSLSPSSEARAYYNPDPVRCDNGSTIIPSYFARYSISCTYDQGGNATCTTAQPLVLPLTSYRWQ